MPSLETLLYRILQSPQALTKLLVGGILSFIPGLNLIALGYIGRMLTQTLETRNIPALPAWDRWGKLLVQGALLFAIGIIYLGLPIALGSLLTGMLREILGNFVGFFTLIPLCVSAAGALPLAFGAAFICLNKGSLHSLWDVKSILELVKTHAFELVAPTCAFWGLQLLGLGLYGIAHFCGLLLYGIYVFRIFQKSQ